MHTPDFVVATRLSPPCSLSLHVCDGYFWVTSPNNNSHACGQSCREPGRTKGAESGFRKLFATWCSGASSENKGFKSKSLLYMGYPFHNQSPKPGVLSSPGQVLQCPVAERKSSRQARGRLPWPLRTSSIFFNIHVAKARGRLYIGSECAFSARQAFAFFVS